MDDTKSFQGYVNQSLMDSGKHIDEDYLTIMTGLFKEGNLNVEQVFMLMRTLVRKQTEEVFDIYLDMNSDIRMINEIIAYESGELNDTKMLELFSELVKNGQAWSLQGHYGRTAAALIQDGFLTRAGEITNLLIELLEEEE